MLLSTGFRKLHVYFVRKLNKNISISVQNSILEYYVGKCSKDEYKMCTGTSIPISTNPQVKTIYILERLLYV